MFHKKLTTVPLIILVSTFIFLDFTLLFLNINLTQKLENDALIINVTGRQRMLSQNIAKNLLLLSSPSTSLSEAAEDKKTVIESARTLNQTLRTLKNGGTLHTPDEKNVTLKAIHDLKSQQLLTKALELWTPVYKMLESDQPYRNNNVLQNYALQTNKSMLFLMNELTIRSEQLSIQKSQTLRIAQIIIFILVLINFLLMIYRLHLANRNSNAFQRNLENLLMNLPQAALLINDNNQITYANAAAEQIFHRTSGRLKGEPITRFIPLPLENCQIQIHDQHFELTQSLAVTIPHELKLISLLNITESVELKQKSNYDVLTPLLNRSGLIEEYMLLAKKAEQICCLFLDLDKFKSINDTYGHPIGDKVLAIVAQRLKSSIKTGDIIARFGGDEFVVMLERPANIKDIDILCNRLESVTNEEIRIGHHSFHLGVSIGVHVGDPQTESFDMIINEADQAMYENKHSNKLVEQLIQGKALHT
ncbi:hypothetical protein CSW98_08365 [Vibrio sp. HA2012]|uniref:diguanylate cyclase domain-containing protein n=1 Tax=Vibrio sp. HA2012 TaxID=1971595 RepID=UPI000C2C17A9|nr:diguanylate cyclase [Vibrio sp. HA2012]PJC86984.1 hypothetical protein CSW98_08365 [Vibrio sp. HA2012]